MWRSRRRHTRTEQPKDMSYSAALAKRKLFPNLYKFTPRWCWSLIYINLLHVVVLRRRMYVALGVRQYETRSKCKQRFSANIKTKLFQVWTKMCRIVQQNHYVINRQIHSGLLSFLLLSFYFLFYDACQKVTHDFRWTHQFPIIECLLDSTQTSVS